jgi:hypothetical protein
VNTSDGYLIDRFPVAGCNNIRIARILQGTANQGASASKRKYCYGFKMQVITTAEGIPMEYFITDIGFADITAFQAMNTDLSTAAGPAGRKAFMADKGWQSLVKIKQTNRIS